MRDLMSKIKYNRPSNTDVAGFGNKIILDAHNNFREDQEKIDKENKSFSISNNEEQLTKKEEEAINIIKSAIEEQLRNMGVGVGALTEYETAAGIEGNYINGVFDPNAKRKTADGLLELIRIAKGIAGNKALPEEFAHLVDAILKATGSPIYDRLNNAITDERMIAAILEADEEGSFEKYFKAYNGDMELMRTEARGKLIKRHILQQNGIGVTP